MVGYRRFPRVECLVKALDETRLQIGETIQF